MTEPKTIEGLGIKVPRVLLTAVGSGSGKTLVAAALLRLFRRRGLKVRGMKVGPDYIDPGFLKVASGAPVENLDLWLSGADSLKNRFVQTAAEADLTVVEGVMGFLDGAVGGRYSTREVAALTGTPAVLILDATGMGQTAAAVVAGLAQRADGLLQGVFLNRVGSERHATLLRSAVEVETGIPVIGHLIRDTALELPSRHLGLVPADETEALDAILDIAADRLADTLDSERLLGIAVSAPPLDETRPARIRATFRVRVGVAWDEAFSFYYWSSLVALRERGAELHFFSPLRDRLPAGLDALYLGGGFPEVFARDLAENQGMQEDIRRFAAAGGPIYAECGGLMYLSERVVAGDMRYPMVGIIPGEVTMGGLSGLGYREGRTLRPTIFGPAGMVLRGHEFHYSRREVSADTAAYELTTLDGDRRLEGFAAPHVLATYLHLDLAGNPEALENFLARAWGWRHE